MKNVSSLKSSEAHSPKTPGGISKSLLTPCRRVGLSRNWKKSGPSPFISPLSGSTPSSAEVQVEKKEPRKRKTPVETEEVEENGECTPKIPTINEDYLDNDENEPSIASSSKVQELVSTPTRHIEVPRKKKSKTLLSALTNVRERNTLEYNDQTVEIATTETNHHIKTSINKKDDTEITDSVAVLKPKLKTKSKRLSSPKNLSKHSKLAETTGHSRTEDNSKNTEGNKVYDKPRSPNDLTKECIVVIQNKIFQTGKQKKPKNYDIKSQAVFDSDSDDMPLCQLNKDIDKSLCNTISVIIEKNIEISPIETKNVEAENNSISNVAEVEQSKIKSPKYEKSQKKETPKEKQVITIEEDDDFTETRKYKVKKLEDKATSIGGLKKKPHNHLKTKPSKPEVQHKVLEFDDDEDFDFDNKKTILIRKTYEKVMKPQKAKSTGSITQKDIDELRARIESKKKLLLAKAISPDTENLRTLIKKWQRGCQDALMELMDLMKNKFPDQQNMDYSAMLSMLKIPSDLVGYDSENDCFYSPDDTNIVLSKLNDV